MRVADLREMARRIAEREEFPHEADICYAVNHGRGKREFICVCKHASSRDREAQIMALLMAAEIRRFR